MILKNTIKFQFNFFTTTNIVKTLPQSKYNMNIYFA